LQLLELFHRVKRRLGYLAAKRRHAHFLRAQRRLVLRRIKGKWSVCSLNTTLSTADVMRCNLDLVANAADDENIPYFWVHNLSRNRYRIGVDVADRERLAQQLVLRYRDEPVYVRVFRQGTSRELLLGSRKALKVLLDGDAWRLCNKYVTPESTFVMDFLHGCDVEFWQEEDDYYATAGRNMLASRLPIDQAVPAKVTLHGGVYPTLAPFVAHRHFESIAIPNDIVYTWVDGSDPEWLEKKSGFMQAVGESALNPEAANASRYMNREELRFSLRSVSMFAAFVRNIYIVTDGQVPNWLDTTHPRIQLVDHRDIFDDEGKLPTFNSHAIESQLHHIPGLAEQYLYLNDDVFFGRHATADQFFLSNGHSKFFLSRHHIDVGPAKPEDPPVMSAAKNGRDLLLERFGCLVTQKQQHVTHPQQRSILVEMERAFSNAFERTSRARFRSVTDISPASALHHYYAYLTGRAVRSSLRYGYINVASPDLESLLNAINRQRTLDVFCLNDTDASPEELRASVGVIRSFLETYFSIPSEWELDQ
jgi:hypothetical protein